MPQPTPLIGEQLALDLLNTRPSWDGGQVDLIGDAEGLRAWLTLEHNRLSGIGAADLAGVAHDARPLLAIRDHIAALVTARRAGQALPEGALEALNAAARQAPLYHGLAIDGSPVTGRLGTPAERLAANFADAAVALLVETAPADIRQCEADDCTMLFVSSNARRHWCASARCGNRARVARYYRRSKEA